MSENDPVSSSPGALRMRRSRERKHRGARIARLELYAEDLAALGQLGWIPSVDCDAAAPATQYPHTGRQPCYSTSLWKPRR
jgi:hypothetical protein